VDATLVRPSPVFWSYFFPTDILVDDIFRANKTKSLPPLHSESAMALLRALSALGASVSSSRLPATRACRFLAGAGLARPFSSGEPSGEQQADLRRHVEGIIKFRGGPITFAEYMRTALTSPMGGFYGDKYVNESAGGSKGTVIGARGDFVTSPEISQLFGEMVGLWCVTVWQQLGSPETLRLVELGPGKGTLMADLLRSTSASSAVFQSFQKALRNGSQAGVNLVEISPAFREAQASALSKYSTGEDSSLVEWHNALQDVPEDGETPTIYIAHEFLDALPVHMFVKKSAAWTELLVDLDDRKAVSLDPEAKVPDPEFVMKLSPGATPSMKLLLHPRLEALDEDTRGEIREIEVSGSVIEHTLAVSNRLAASKGGGAALFIDYGYDDLPGKFTCRAIRDHKLLDDLLAPCADLTADVDFSLIRSVVEKMERAPAVFGPISQSRFLQSLGIGYRAQALLETPGISEKQAEDLVEGYKRLVGGADVDGMGEIYKAMALVALPESAEGKAGPPVGF